MEPNQPHSSRPPSPSQDCQGPPTRHHLLPTLKTIKWSQPQTILVFLWKIRTDNYFFIFMNHLVTSIYLYILAVILIYYILCYISVPHTLTLGNLLLISPSIICQKLWQIYAIAIAINRCSNYDTLVSVYALHLT